MRRPGPSSLAVVLLVSVVLAVAGCGGDAKTKTGAATTATRSATTPKTSTTPTKPKQAALPLHTKKGVVSCLSKKGIKTSKTLSGKANDVKGTARTSFSGKFKGSTFGTLVDDVAFLIYKGRAPAKAALLKLKGKVPKKHLIFRNNLVVVFAGKYNQPMRKFLTKCVGKPTSAKRGAPKKKK